MTTVTVYTTEKCPACDRTKQVLTQQGVDFVAQLATEEDRQAFIAEGVRSFPVVKYQNTMFSGFQMAKLRALAKDFFAQDKVAMA